MKKIKNKPNYYIAPDGRIWSNISNKYIKPHINKSNGYLQIRLGRGKIYYIHRLVAEIFNQNINKYKCVNHIDGNKLNNCFFNLEWCTHSENSIHALKNNLIKLPPVHSGEDNGNSKLTNKERDNIVNKYKQGNITQRKLALKYNITRPAIGYVLKTWRHIQ